MPSPSISGVIMILCLLSIPYLLYKAIIKIIREIKK